MSQNPAAPFNPPPFADPTAPALAGAPAAGSGRFKNVDPFRLVREHLRLILVVFILSIGVGVATYVALLRFMPQYTSYTQLIVTGGLADVYQAPGQTGFANQQNTDLLESFMNTQVLVIKSQAVIDRALQSELMQQTKWIESFKEYDRPAPAADGDNADAPAEAAQRDYVLDMASAREDLLEVLSISAERNSMLISGSASVRSKDDAPRILDAVIDSYLQIVATRDAEQYNDVRQAFVRELRDADLALEQIQNAKKAFTNQHNLPSLQAELNDAAFLYRTLGEELAKLKLTAEQYVAAYQSALAAYQSQQASPLAYQEISLAPSVYQREEQLRQLRQQREALLERFGQNHRVIRNIDVQMEVIEQEKQLEVQRLVRERLAVQVDAARSSLEAMQANLDSLEAKTADARNQMRDLTILLQEFDQLNTQEEQARDRRLRARQVLDDIKLRVDRPDSTRIQRQLAATEAELSFPRLVIVVPTVMFLLTGGVVGLLFVKEMLDQRVTTPADLQGQRSMNLLGVVPDAREDPSEPQRIEGIVLRDPRGLMAETFRQLRTAVLNRMDRRGYKSLMVTCPQPEAGASTIASNLAASVASQGKRVLLIDANIRRPSQHETFSSPATPGLVEILRGSASVDDATRYPQAEGDRPDRASADNPAARLALITAGDTRQAAPELLEGAAFRSLINQLESEYDLIVIDAPPGLVASDAQMIAKCVDAAVVVVRAVSDKRGMVSRLVNMFEGQRADLLGVVLNGARTSRTGYFRESYRQFYRYQRDEKRQPRSRTEPETAAAGQSNGR